MLREFSIDGGSTRSCSDDLLGKSGLFARHLLSGDGRFAVTVTPGEKIRLYEMPERIPYFQFFAQHISADAAAFNLVDGVTTELALITDNGESLTRIDLVRKRILDPFPLENASAVDYGVTGTIFIGTTLGEVIMLSLEGGELSEEKRQKFGDYQVVLLAASPLIRGAVVAYTDNRELINTSLLSGETVPESDKSIESMRFHPTLPIFAALGDDAQISISSELGWYVIKVRTEHQILSVIPVDDCRSLLVSPSEVVEVTVVYPSDPEGQMTLKWNWLYERRSGHRILGATVEASGSLTVMTTASD
jgi:hypothetical protein